MSNIDMSHFTTAEFHMRFATSKLHPQAAKVAKHAFIYAGIQKNLGPAGMSVGFLRPDFADGSKELKICPTYCSFKTTGDNGSMYNTPACFTMYVMGDCLVFQTFLLILTFVYFLVFF